MGNVQEILSGMHMKCWVVCTWNPDWYAHEILSGMHTSIMMHLQDFTKIRFNYTSLKEPFFIIFRIHISYCSLNHPISPGKAFHFLSGINTLNALTSSALWLYDRGCLAYTVTMYTFWTSQERYFIQSCFYLSLI